MHFRLHNKRELSKKIALNIKAIERNTIVSSLSNIKMEVLDSTLILTTFDGNNCVISNIAIDNVSGVNSNLMLDSITFRTLIDRLSKLKSEMIEFELLEESSELSIKSGRTKVKIKTIADTTDFATVPSLEQFKNFKSMSFDKKELIQAVSRVSKCSVRNNTQPVLEAVNLVVENNKCDIISLDGYRLGLNTIDCESNYNFKISVSANRLKDVLKDVSLSEEDVIEIKSNGVYALIQSGEINIFIREIEGNMAPYKRLLNKEYFYEILVNKDEMESILNSSMVATSKDNKIVKLLINPETSTIEFNSSGDIIRDFTEDMDIQFVLTEEEELNIAFNATYLLELINNIETENVRMYLKNPISPVYIENEEDTGDTYLVLPVRINR